jgi:hypothetical protein
VFYVKKSVDEQKQILIIGFSQGINKFAEFTKAEIQYQIEQLVESKSAKSPKSKKVKVNPQPVMPIDNEVHWAGIVADVGGGLIDLVSQGLGNIFRIGVRASESLLKAVSTSFPENFNSYDSDTSEVRENYDPYIIRVKTKKEAQKLGSTINEFCAPYIQSLWLDTQDKLLREGTEIRGKLAIKIKSDIQQISDELSNYLGDALQVELNINPIQFPSFEFSGIDAKIKQQQEVFKKTKREEKTNSRCCDSDEVYYVDVEYEDKREFYEVDLHETAKLIKEKIDEQIVRNQQLLQRVIEKQVAEDFRNAEQQINDYIKRFQDEFDRLLKERETKEAEGDRIREMLEIQKAQLNEYLRELITIKASLDSWKPIQTIR